MELTTRAPQAPSPLAMNSKPRVILLYLIHKVSMKALRRSVGGMTYRPISKLVAPSRTYWSSPGTKTPWSYIGSNVMTLPVMMNTWRNLQDFWRKIQRAPEGLLPHTSSQGQYRPSY